MNKKLLSVILGIIVLFVWYKVISSFFGENVEDQSYQPQLAYENLDLSAMISNDSIPQPDLDYRDPFLGKVSFNTRKNKSKTKSSTSTSKKSFERPLSNEQKLKWPQISYHGFVKVHGSESSLVLLKVNKQLVHISEGGAYVSTLYVRKAYRDSILLEMNGDRKVFHK